ncbi:MAG: hypothetical protein JWR44_2626, partial [Hymenobacter sp.]|nr:hypothetical protein [Hymenobacter sp.]
MPPAATRTTALLILGVAVTVQLQILQQAA